MKRNTFSMMPEWDYLADKRMGEMTPEEADNAKERWVRHQLEFFSSYDQAFIAFLLRRLDELRGIQPEVAKN